MQIFDLVDVVEMSKHRCEYPIEAKLKYVTSKNFMGCTVSGYTPGFTEPALLGKETAEKLCEVQKFLNELYGYGLLIFDAYRPKTAIIHFLSCFRENPECSFTLGYAIENSEHCYANTIDLVLKDLNTNRTLHMGTQCDFMGQRYHTMMEKEIGNEVFHHRQILSIAMKKFGFKHDEDEEYWNFSYKGKAGRHPKGPLDVRITPQVVETVRKLSN